MIQNDIQNAAKTEVAVVGLLGSGKTALTDALNNLSEAFIFDEHQSHEEMDVDKHEVVLQVVDATRLRESLLLTPSFIEHRHHLVIAINRYDELLKTGHRLDIGKFSEQIGVPVVLVSSVTGEGVQDVLRALEEVAARSESHAHPIVHGWEETNAEAWHGYMEGLLAQTLEHPEQDTATWEERVNRLLTNKWTGFPILFIVVGFVFWCTFALGGPIQDWLQSGIDWAHEQMIASMPDAWYTGLLADGIVLGVGSLLTALPNIVILFFFLSVMEETGYTARISFLMDGIMHAVGLHGRSFFPLIMGLDCNVPAIIAARNIPNERDRRLTMLMVPFMSCSARLPVYILLISTFFAQQYRALVLASIYLLGFLLSFAYAWLMKHTRWFRGERSDMVNELPDFKWPTMSSLGRLVWFRVSDFLKKITTVVLIASIVIWVLEYFPSGDLANIEQSWLAAIGQFIAPVFAPLGFDWRMDVCLLTGVPAKEAIAATFAMLYGNDLSGFALSGVQAYAFMAFIALYFPCVATVSTLRKELGYKWSTAYIFQSLIQAWVVAFIIYQVGSLLV